MLPRIKISCKHSWDKSRKLVYNEQLHSLQLKNTLLTVNKIINMVQNSTASVNHSKRVIYGFVPTL